MNSLVIVLIAIVLWMAYTMYRSYTAMEKELREIRMKCMGTSSSNYNQSPGESMRKDVVGMLSRLASMTADPGLK